MAALDIGALYCEIDEVLYSAFNADLVRAKCKTKSTIAANLVKSETRLMYGECCT